MKTSTLVVLLFISTFGWARANPNPADYTVNVQVSKSHMTTRGNSSVHWQELSVVIDGKKYELESEGAPDMLLALGDYKARLVKDEHKGTYDSFQLYEFLFPDQKTRRFIVVERTE